MLRPFLLRRVKTEVEQTLPSKLETLIRFAQLIYFTIFSALCEFPSRPPISHFLIITSFLHYFFRCPLSEMQRFWIKALLLRESSAIMGLEDEENAEVDPENPAGTYFSCFLFARDCCILAPIYGQQRMLSQAIEYYFFTYTCTCTQANPASGRDYSPCWRSCARLPITRICFLVNH